MIYNKDTASKVAEYLLQIKAVVLQPQKPFTWASGLKSPIYCDNRKTLSFPHIRNFIRHEMACAIEEKFGRPDLIAGVATGAIAQGVLVAQEMGLPFVYVRAEPKSHGLENLVEGVVEKGQSVVVVEDLVSTGGSSLKAVDALKKAGCRIKGMVAIFSYGFPQAEGSFKLHNCPLVNLCDYDSLLQKALESKFIKEREIETLNEWRQDPKEWQP